MINGGKSTIIVLIIQLKINYIFEAFHPTVFFWDLQYQTTPPKNPYKKKHATENRAPYLSSSNE